MAYFIPPKLIVREASYACETLGEKLVARQYNGRKGRSGKIP